MGTAQANPVTVFIEDASLPRNTFAVSIPGSGYAAPERSEVGALLGHELRSWFRFRRGQRPSFFLIRHASLDVTRATFSKKFGEGLDLMRAPLWAKSPERVDRRASGETGEEKIDTCTKQMFPLCSTPYISGQEALLRLELVYKSDPTLVSLRDQRFQKTHIASGLDNCARVPDGRCKMQPRLPMLRPSKKRRKAGLQTPHIRVHEVVCSKRGGAPPFPPSDTHAAGSSQLTYVSRLYTWRVVGLPGRL